MTTSKSYDFPNLLTQVGSFVAWHIDQADWKDDRLEYAKDMTVSGVGGVDILINNEHELRYLDPPGWYGLQNRDIYSFHVYLKIVVYDMNSSPPLKEVKESNTLELYQTGVWKNL